MTVMTAPTGALQAYRLSTGPLHIGWIQPDFVHDLPLAVDDADDLDATADRLYELARDLLPHRAPTEQHTLARLLIQSVGQLIGADAVYAGLCLIEHEGEPSVSSLAVTHTPRLPGDEEQACELMAEALGERFPDDEVGIIELPQLRAVSRIARDWIALPAEIAPDGQTHQVPRNLIQVFLPLPRVPELLTFELSSISENAWALHSQLFAEILRSIDWTTDQELADTARLAAVQQPYVPEQGSGTSAADAVARDFG
ncbi:hypothetical protein [Streptomyces blattellae]|uniref:hypothetical protein n=1 Tax=Streptomyces blattellae TaxID=2569855 RepID=UPI0012BA349C|nr:hypothetical protein [Streptomyces blattellae]